MTEAGRIDATRTLLMYRAEIRMDILPTSYVMMQRGGFVDARLLVWRWCRCTMMSCRPGLSVILSRLSDNLMASLSGVSGIGC